MMIRKIQYIFILLCLPVSLLAQEKFNIRGVLPWHNFLSGSYGLEFGRLSGLSGTNVSNMVLILLDFIIIPVGVNVMPLMWNR